MSTGTGTRELLIRRSDGHMQRFVVHAGKYTSLLDGLEEVRTKHDRGLLYRHSCHHGSCGTCGVQVNGERALACTTFLKDLPQETRVEPLDPFDRLGDLAVNAAELYRDFPRDAGYLRESEANPDTEVPQEITATNRDAFVRFEDCIECGLCVSSCPVTRTFKGPAALAAYGRELEKHPEREEELLPEIDTPDGVWGCDRAFACSRVCPLGVAPARHIAVLQRRIQEHKGTEKNTH